MATPPPSPHAEYDRWIERRERWGAWWRRFGQIAFYVVGGILAMAFAALLVASLIDSAQPRIWGTFTQTGCEERFRGGCRPFGTWVSDDETIVLHDVYLDGWTDESGTARAGYQPTALVGSDIVRVPFLSGFGPWLIGGILVWSVGYALYKAASWGDLPRPGSRWLDARGPARPQGALGTRGSLRRQYRRSLERGQSETADADPHADSSAP